MAISRAGEMRFSLRCTFYLVVLWVAGTNSSTLRLHPEQRYMLPQNRGFFTVKANEDLPAGDGGGTAAPALPLAARSAAGSGSDSNLQHRSRRSAGESTMPKVYGQVMYCVSFGAGLVPMNTVHHPRLPLADKDVLEDIMQAPGCFLSHLIFDTLTPTCA